MKNKKITETQTQPVKLNVFSEEEKLKIAGDVQRRLKAMIKNSNNDPYMIAGAQPVMQAIGMTFSTYDNLITEQKIKIFLKQQIRVQKKKAPTETWVIDLLKYATKLYLKGRFNGK